MALPRPNDHHWAVHADLPSSEPKLLELVMRAGRAHQFSPRTIEVYVDWSAVTSFSTTSGTLGNLMAMP
jgi:hypothetical protein